MGTTNVSVSLDEKLLEDVDRFAEIQKQSRNVVLKDALNEYLNKHSFDQFAEIRKEIRDSGITMDDIAAEIKAYRNEKKMRNL